MTAPVSEGRVPVERLRAAVSRGVDATSLRQVARDVGMSPSGLQKFLAGASPYTATRRKLERWYALGGEGPDLHTALAALELLVVDLPPSERHEAINQILDAVVMVHSSRRRRRPPGWIKDLREQLSAER